MGSGICDLRSAVGAQQKQLDGLIDRVAQLLSAMHEDLVKDAQAMAQRDHHALEHTAEELQQFVHQRLLESEREAKEHIEKLHVAEAQQRERLESLLQDEIVSRLDAEVHSVHERFEGEREELQRGLGASFHELQEQLQRELSSMSARLGHLEDEATLASCRSDGPHELKDVLHRSCAELRQEMRQAASETEASLAVRLSDLEARVEEQLEARVVSMLRPLSTVSSERDSLLDTHRDRLEHVEAEARKADRALEHLSDEVRLLRQHGFERPEDERDAGWLWHVDSRLTFLGSLESRLSGVEQSIHRLPDERLGRVEQRVESLDGRMDSMQQSLPVRREQLTTVEQRLDKLNEHVDSVLASVQQELRHTGYRLSEVKTLAARMAGSEKLVDSLQRQLLETRGESRQLLAGAAMPPEVLAQLEQRWTAHFSALAEELREELREELCEVRSEELRKERGRSELDCPRLEELRRELATQSQASQRLRELQLELETQLGQERRGQEQLRQELLAVRRTAERASEELLAFHADLNGRATEEHSAAQHVVGRFRRELEERAAQAEAHSQRLAEELRFEMEQGQRQARLQLEALQQTLHLLEAACEPRSEMHSDWEQQLRQLRATSQQALEQLDREAAHQRKDSARVEEELRRIQGDLRKLQQHLENVDADCGRLQEEFSSQYWRQEFAAMVGEVESHAERLVANLRLEMDGNAAQAAESGRQLAEEVRHVVGLFAANTENSAHQDACAPGLSSPVQGKSAHCVWHTLTPERGAASLPASPVHSALGIATAIGAGPLPGLPFGHALSRPTPQALLSPGARSGSPTALQQHLLQQERLLEELCRGQRVLHDQVEGYRLEHKVSKSLAGLERGELSASPERRRAASLDTLRTSRSGAMQALLQGSEAEVAVLWP